MANQDEAVFAADYKILTQTKNGYQAMPPKKSPPKTNTKTGGKKK
jgi:hypothetical protein